LQRINLKAEEPEKKDGKDESPQQAPLAEEAATAESPTSHSPPSCPPVMPQIPIMTRTSTSLGRFGDIIVFVLVAFIALLLARRAAVSLLQ